MLVAALAGACAGSAAAQTFDKAQMPPVIEALFRASGNTIDANAPCELIDWLADAANGMPPDAVKTAARYVDICALPVDDLTPEIALQRLGNDSLRLDVEDDVLTAIATTSAPQAIVCCAPQMSLVRLADSNYWAARRRLADAERAMISLALIGDDPQLDWKTWRGPKAPPKPDEVEIGQWKGQMLERELRSSALGETRTLMIYLPPGHSNEKSWPALFMTDAGAVEFAGLVEKMVDAGEISPIVIVSAESGEEAVVGDPPTQYGDDLRSADYLRGWPQAGDRFDRHMKFFSKEMVDYAVAEFGVSADRQDRAVSGKSSGGVFAMWAGVMRPEIFAHAIPMSGGWITLRPEHLSAGERARFFVSAGRYEPGFIQPMRTAETVLKDAGYDVTARYYAAGHYHDQWAVALRDALIEIFPPS